MRLICKVAFVVYCIIAALSLAAMTFIVVYINYLYIIEHTLRK